MKVLFLGPADSPLLEFLAAREQEVHQTVGRLTPDALRERRFDFLVSYGYRYILKPEVLALFPERAVNLHISLLPWNRGADPNFWSFLEGAPKGVTVHYLDAGVDTGDIIVQKEVSFPSDATLRTSYERLQSEIQTLFRSEWERIRVGRCARQPQRGPGSVHRARDKERFLYLLHRGWDTPVAALEAAAGWCRIAAPTDTRLARGLALGTVQWGQTYGIANRTGQPAQAAVAKLLAHARSAGVCVLDTARAYGSSEQTIGNLTNGDAHWVIVTKLDPAANTAAAAAASLEQSRRELRRPVLDAVQLHRAEQRTADGGRLWNLLRTERERGRVAALGVSAGSPEEAWAALEDADVQCVQVASSLFDRRLARAGYFERAAAAGKVVFVRSVFLQGAAHLAPHELPQHLLPLRESLTAIHAWARQHDATVAQCFLAFAARLPCAWVLVGCETVGQLDQNLADWTAARRRAEAIGPLADAIPELPDTVLNPALWPRTAGYTAHG